MHAVFQQHEFFPRDILRSLVVHSLPPLKTSHVSLKRIFTHDLEEAHLAYHGVGVHLAHVITSIVLLHAADM